MQSNSGEKFQDIPMHDITPNSTIEVDWEVLPMDYTKEQEKNIKQLVSDKYGVPIKNVKVFPNFIMLNKQGEKIPLTNDTIVGIKDPKFQQSLFKEYLEVTGKQDYDWDAIIAIDNQLNSAIAFDSYDKFKRYSLKWIRWSNFLSYGKDNYFDFTKLKGLVLVNGEPSNQSGKTTFSIELLRFLLFGKTSKYNTLAQNFNNVLPEETEMKVEGEIEIEDERYIIRRTVTRPSLKRRKENSAVKQKVEYYKILADGEEVLLEDDEDTENMQRATGQQTNKAIKEAIGTEQDFDLTICATNNNLTDLISFKETDRGRLLSRWIGLLPLENKDKLGRETYNKKILPSLVSNRYNRETLLSENESNTKLITSYNEEIIKRGTQLQELNNQLQQFKNEQLALMEKKLPIDQEVMNLDITTHMAEIERVKQEGIRYKAKKEENLNLLSQLPEEDFNEQEYTALVQEKARLEYAIVSYKQQITKLKNEANQLKQGEYCPTCHRKFENVDNTTLIEERRLEVEKLIEQGKQDKARIDSLGLSIAAYEQKRKNFNERSRLVVENQSLDLRMDNLRERLINLNSILKLYQKNKEAIDYNANLSIQMNNVKARIDSTDYSIRQISQESMQLQNDVKYAEERIRQNNELVLQIAKDEKVKKDWLLYLEMVGKNGVSKMVLRNALPIINAELKRLLSDVCNFDVEISVNDKNEVIFTYCKEGGVWANISGASGLEQTVSSLALRTVLANISTMPKLNYIVLDELWGCVADDNLSRIRPFIEMIASSYDFILQVSHNPLIADWHDRVITIASKNNVSYIK